MKVYVLVDKNTYEFLGVRGSLEKAEDSKKELIDELPNLENNVEILERNI